MYIHPTDIVFTDKHKDEMLECAKNGDWINHTSHFCGSYQPYEFITDYTGRLKIDNSILKAKQIVRNNNPENSYLPRFQNSHATRARNEYLKLFSSFENYDFLSNQATQKSGFSYAHRINSRNFLNLSLNQKNDSYLSLTSSYDPINNFVSNGPSVNYSYKAFRNCKFITNSLIFI